jgi:hypothetical protein
MLAREATTTPNFISQPRQVRVVRDRRRRQMRSEARLPPNSVRKLAAAAVIGPGLLRQPSPQRSTITTSNLAAVGGNPVSYLALMSASRFP